jgi:hypothetical protein
VLSNNLNNLINKRKRNWNRINKDKDKDRNRANRDKIIKEIMIILMNLVKVQVFLNFLWTLDASMAKFQTLKETKFDM